MKVNEILRKAAALLGLEDETDFGLAEGVGKTMGELVSCASSVIRETGAYYLPLIRREKIVVDGGSVSYGALQRRAVKIISVKKDGCNVKFTCYPAHMRVETAGECEVEYVYLAEDAVYGGEAECDIRLTADTLAYGVAAEYSLMKGDYERANACDFKFREGLSNASLDRREIKIKGRKW